MAGSFLTYAASRLANRAITTVEREIIWMGLAGLLFLSAFAFFLYFAFLLIDTQLGPVYAAGIVTAGCIVLGTIAVFMPRIIARAEAAHQEQISAGNIAQAVDQEVHAAADALGPIRLTASAFMLGLGAARRVKRRNG